MQLQHVQCGDAAVSHILTLSPYDEQHTAAGYFCVKRNFGFKRGLSAARAEDPDIWPAVTGGSLRRVLDLHGDKFKSVPDFHLSKMKRSDGRSILTQLEMEDMAASMREEVLFTIPYASSETGEGNKCRQVSLASRNRYQGIAGQDCNE